MNYPDKLERNSRYYYLTDEHFETVFKLVDGFIVYDYSLGMHVQDFFEINIIMRGTGMHYIQNNRLPVKQGDVFILPPSVEHGYVGNKGFDVYHFLLSNKFMEKNMVEFHQFPSFSILFNAEPLMRAADSTPLYLQLSDSQFQVVMPLLREIVERHNPQSAADATIQNNYAGILIATICQFYTQNALTAETSPKNADAAFMNALTLIHERYYEKISIEQLARIALLSRSSFIRKFQEVCNTSPGKYLMQIRSAAAEQMLVHTNFTVAEVAQKTGFYDISHFVKVFTAETGDTPNAYRKKHFNSSAKEN